MVIVALRVRLVRGRTKPLDKATPPPEAGLPLRAQQVDLRSPGRLARRHRLSARLPAGPEIADGIQRRQVQRHPSHQARLGVLPQRRKTILWPHIDAEYQQELQGIADGLKAHGVSMDLWDVVALNAMEEVPDYYVPTLDRQQKARNAPKLTAPGNCSAFVATGSMTKDHKPVIAHSNWTEHSRSAAAGPSSSTSCPRTATA